MVKLIYTYDIITGSYFNWILFFNVGIYRVAGESRWILFDSYILCKWIFILSSYEVSDFYAQRKCVSLAYVVWPCKTDIKLILRQVLLCEKISIMKLKVVMVSWNEDIHGKFPLVS